MDKRGVLLISQPNLLRDLLEGLRGAMRGEAVISAVLAGRMLGEFRRLSQLAQQEAYGDELATLTGREKEILSQVVLGRSDKEIAAMFSISLNTVKSHLRNILAKLQVNSRREAARLARNKGLL
jgi:DNA-binding NarL/FixJ family response regulator